MWNFIPRHQTSATVKMLFSFAITITWSAFFSRIWGSFRYLSLCVNGFLVHHSFHWLTICIYIYIYVCVCVCVCVDSNDSQKPPVPLVYHFLCFQTTNQYFGSIQPAFVCSCRYMRWIDYHRKISNKTFDFKSNYSFTPFSSLIYKDICVGLAFCLHIFEIIFFGSGYFFRFNIYMSICYQSPFSCTEEGLVHP